MSVKTGCAMVGIVPGVESPQTFTYPPVKDEDATTVAHFVLNNRLSPRQVLLDDSLLVVVTVKRTRLELVGKTMAVERNPAPFSASDIANGLLSIRTKDEIRPPVFGTLDCVGNNLERLLLLVQLLPLQEPELHLFVEAGH